MAHPPGTSPDAYVENTRFMWRMLGLLFTVGATIGGLSVLLPHPASFETPALWTNIAAAYGAGAICFLCAGRLPAWPIHLFLLAGTVLVTRAIYLSDEPGGFYTMFYIWIGLYVFGFFRLRVAIAYLLGVAAAYGWVLLALNVGAGAPARWTTLIGTIALAGVVVSALVERMRQAAADSASIARERGELMGRLEHVARTDELTGLPNRRAWNEEISREMARARRTETPLSVALLDLDHFKRYNDAYGHHAGDELLRELAVSWRSHLRASDLLSRYGGEEFAVALPDCDLDDARMLIERLRAAGNNGETCSAGIAQWDGQETPQKLVDRADQALYAAKAAGRDRVALG